MTSTEIQSYWNTRAKAQPSSATTNDIWLRELETQTLAREIRTLEPSSVLDLGCGDAATTIRLALQFPRVQFTGMDYSSAMLELGARAMELNRSKGSPLANLHLIEGDVLCDPFPDTDLFISCRCLINIPNETWPDPRNKLRERLRNRTCRMIENFLEPHQNLNEFRARCGLPAIEIQPQNSFEWTGCYHDNSLRQFSDSYYFATRVIYASECKLLGVKPDYNASQHKSAIHLPCFDFLNCGVSRMITSPF